MSVDWIALSKQAGLPIIDGRIRVDFRNDRRQIVRVDATRDDLIRVWSIVAKASVVDALDEALLRAWRRNRLTELVGFRCDGRGRMIGEAWVPEDGLTADEWGFAVSYLAKVCDGFEYVLTGRDSE